MTATNHALTGAAIGLLIGNPLIALPLAFASHFACDALPHFGANNREKFMKSQLFKNYLMMEAGLCFLIVVALAWRQPAHWQLACVTAFLAASPDLFWIKQYRAALTHRKWRPNLFDKFAGNIQWFQKPIGALVELAWLVAASVILLPIIR